MTPLGLARGLRVAERLATTESGGSRVSHNGSAPTINYAWQASDW